MDALLAERQKDREAAERRDEQAERREVRHNILYSIALCAMICIIWHLIHGGH